MSSLPEDVQILIGLLQQYDVEFAVCGGYAVAFHGYPRLTMDVDLLILPSDSNASRVLAALSEFGFGDAGIPSEALTREGSAITLGVQPNQVDLLTSMSRTPTADVIERAEWGDLSALRVKFVSRKDLMEAKRQSDRLKDRADLDELAKMDVEAGDPPADGQRPG